jgi:hypothetical protein
MRYILFQGAWSDCLFVQGCGRTRRFFLNDFIKYMCIHLSSGQTPEDIRIYPKTTMVLFSTKVTGLLYNNTRAFGWDTILVQTYPPYGHKFSVNSFGHIDFIGTSIRAGKGIVHWQPSVQARSARFWWYAQSNRVSEWTHEDLYPNPKDRKW